MLRRYVRADQVADDPAVAAHEAAVLELVERIAIPTPRLIGVDPTGEHAGTPAVLMTELAGQPQWAANRRWMRQLVEVLIEVHAIDAVAVRPFAVYARESYVLPKWATKPTVWERAIGRERVVGPADRVGAGRLGGCQYRSAFDGRRPLSVNLLYDGLDTAELFTRRWEHITGHTFHRWADRDGHRPPRL